MNVTVNDLLPNVRRAVAGRILRHLETSPTISVKEATRRAAWENLREARAAGWDQRGLEAMVQTYVIVGTHIAAEAARAH